jgi:hypothetical protein
MKQEKSWDMDGRIAGGIHSKTMTSPTSFQAPGSSWEAHLCIQAPSLDSVLGGRLGAYFRRFGLSR